MNRLVSFTLVTLVSLILVITSAHAVPFWGDKESQDPNTSPKYLKPGLFV